MKKRMKHNKFSFIAVIAVFCVTVLFSAVIFSWAKAEAVLNAGFVKGVWYSKTPFVAGENVRIYAAFQNRSGFDLIGKVKFFVDEKVLSETDFSALDGRLIEIWADWKAVEGKHAIFVEIVAPKKSSSGKEPEPVKLDSSFSSEDAIFVDAAAAASAGLGEEKGKEEIIGGSAGPEQGGAEKTDKTENNQSGAMIRIYDSAKKIGTVVLNAVSVAVSPAVSPIAKKIDDFSEKQGKKIEENIKEIKAEMELEKISDPETKNIGKQIEYYGLAFVSFFLSQKLLKYFVFFLILFLIYRIIKKIFS